MALRLVKTGALDALDAVKVALRLIAEPISSSGFFRYSLRNIFSLQPAAERTVSRRCSVPEHIFIGEAEFPKDADDIRELFEEYAAWLARHDVSWSLRGPRSGMIEFRSWRRFRGSTLRRAGGCCWHAAIIRLPGVLDCAQ